MPCSAEQDAVAEVVDSLMAEAGAEGASEEVHLVGVVPLVDGKHSIPHPCCPYDLFKVIGATCIKAPT